MSQSQRPGQINLIESRSSDCLLGDTQTPGYLKCVRPSDGALIYLDDAKRAIVIVKDGKIVTYYAPTGDFDYFWSECNG